MILNKPYTNKQYANFAVESNLSGLIIEDKGDYLESVEPPAPLPEKQKEREIYRLKDELADTDYKIIKCSEYQLAGQVLPYDITELHATRQALRDRINELEG